MSDEPDDDLSDVLRNLRLDGHFRFKTGVYRRLEEQDDARQALIGLGIRVTDFRQAERGDDPPDSTCRVDGKLSGIEVTEILHDAVMKERLRGDHGRHHEWTDSEIIAALSKQIAEKDQAKPKGGPYERYLLVIRTEELHMELPRMGPILRITGPNAP